MERTRDDEGRCATVCVCAIESYRVNVCGWLTAELNMFTLQATHVLYALLIFAGSTTFVQASADVTPDDDGMLMHYTRFYSIRK